MKLRWKIPAAILLGAIVNIAIAWSCAQLGALPRISQWDPGDSLPERMVVPIPDDWHLPIHDLASRVTVTHAEFGTYGATALVVLVSEETPDQERYQTHAHSRLQVGWPMRSLYCVSIHGPTGTPEFHGVISLPDPPPSNDGWPEPARHRVLPVRVLPLGCIADTMLYTAATLGLLCLPSALRWYRRGLKSRQMWQRVAFRGAPCVAAGLVVSVVVAGSCALWMPVSLNAVSQRYRTSPPSGQGFTNYKYLDVTPGVWIDGDLDPSRRGATPESNYVSSEHLKQTFELMEELAGGDFRHHDKPGVYASEERLAVESGIGVRMDWMSLATHTDRGRGGPSFSLQRAGWPMYCVCSYTPNTSGDMSTHGAIESPKWLHARESNGRPRRLLFLPMWPGLICDTVFFSCIACGAIFGPRRLRRAIRAGRGQCIWCGYDRRGLADDDYTPCPECGKPAH